MTPLLGSLPLRRGHFRYESGHHGELWLDLELLCLYPDRIRPHADRLAAAISSYDVEVVCGPLVEGAFVALMVAAALDVPFTYSERIAEASPGLFPVRYPIPRPLRAHLRGRRVAVVNDVINAGSAVRGTLASLRDCGARPVAIATLAVLGDAADRLAADAGLSLEVLERLPSQLWTPANCPGCARGVPLTDLITNGEEP
jgi:orotate phosphoribosyltransferase